MEEKFIRILQTVAHLGEKLRVLAEDLDTLYCSLTDPQFIELFKEFN